MLPHFTWVYCLILHSNTKSIFTLFLLYTFLSLSLFFIIFILTEILQPNTFLYLQYIHFYLSIWILRLCEIYYPFLIEKIHYIYICILCIRYFLCKIHSLKILDVCNLLSHTHWVITIKLSLPYWRQFWFSHKNKIFQYWLISIYRYRYHYCYIYIYIYEMSSIYTQYNLIRFTKKKIV